MIALDWELKRHQRDMMYPQKRENKMKSLVNEFQDLFLDIDVEPDESQRGVHERDTRVNEHPMDAARRRSVMENNFLKEGAVAPGAEKRKKMRRPKHLPKNQMDFF